MWRSGKVINWTSRCQRFSSTTGPDFSLSQFSVCLLAPGGGTDLERGYGDVLRS